MMRISWVTD